MRERLRGTQSLAAERVRNAASVTETELQQGRDPEELEAEAEQVRGQEQQIAAEVEGHRTALEQAVSARRAAEDAAAEEERRLAGLQRAAADRREGLARLHGQVNALKSRAAAADDEIGRLSLAREDAVARADRAQREFTSLETKVAGLDAGEEGLDAEHEAAVAALSDIEDRLAKARDEAQQADRDRSALGARKDALEMGLNRKDGVGALLAASDSVSGLLGSVAALLTVRPGYQTAVASALGSAADAVAVTDTDAAVAAIAHLKGDDLGRAGLLLGGGPADRPGLARTGPALPAARGVRRRRGGVPRPPAPRADPPAVQDRRRRRPRRRAAAWSTRCPTSPRSPARATCSAAHFAAGGSTGQQSLIEIQAAVDEADAAFAEAVAVGERLGFDMSRLETERLDAQQRVDVALAKLHESDATLAAVAEELGQHHSQSRSARGEADRLTVAIEKAQAAREQDLAGLAELEARLASAEDAPDEEPDTTDVQRLAEAARQARAGRDGRPARHCVRRRSGPAPCTAASTRWCAPPRPSATRGPRRPSAASGCCARAGPPRRSASR